MASRRTRVVVLMSIKPDYAERILSGDKHVEFRKVRFARAISHVIIYATAPVQQVVGYFEVEAVEEGAPDELWSRHASVGGIDLDLFRAYYKNESRGTAILVGRVSRLGRPLALDALEAVGPPPQSFRYIDAAALRRLSRRATEISPSRGQQARSAELISAPVERTGPGPW